MTMSHSKAGLIQPYSKPHSCCKLGSLRCQETYKGQGCVAMASGQFNQVKAIFRQTKACLACTAADDAC